LIREVRPSPDGRWILATVLHRPFSYRVPHDRFPHRIEVWDAAGKLARLVADNPLAEEVPILFSAVPTGPRDPAWRGDADATVCWLEALDGGEPARAADLRDEVRCLAAPFERAPRRLIAVEYRLAGVRWSSGKLALVSEWWWDNRKTRTHVVAPDDPAAKPRVLWDRSFEDRYSDPGEPLTRLSPRGTELLLVSGGGSLLLSGRGASPEGDRPFLDRLELASGKSTRLWRSEAPYYEQVFDAVDDDARRVLTLREALAEPPQVYLRGLPGKLERLTSYPHPTPALARVQKRQLRYKRADGVDLTGMLYLPPGHDPGKHGRLPVLLWAYPQEYKSAAAAGQVKDSPYRFARIGYWGPLFALTQGFAVLDNPSFPIVGEGDAEPNDTYREQLVAGARAAVDELVRIGVGDRGRMAIGGHSYGAFTTANLLAHSDLFRAGIARSGAYNRTLTPFGFQAEQRTFWQAQQTYMEMSPFTHAEKIDEPILLIHGQADNNSGTYPIQSERLFEALQGVGGVARLVMLPAESHGYRARESVLHQLWEMVGWLEKHVKSAPPRDRTAGR
jgi:dipeptidyl aminopeptidase/acylaminoacyl peptidase